MRILVALAALCMALCLALGMGAGIAAAPAVTEAQDLIGQAKIEAALDLLDDYLAGAPQDAEARFLRGTILAQLNRTDEALKAFTDLAREFPQLAEPHNNAAVIYAQRGEYEKARQALDLVLASHPDYATAHENLADIYAALAVKEYERVQSLGGNPDVADKIRVLDQLSGGPGPVCPPCAEGGATAQGSASHPAVAAVRAWAVAWSARDADAYLASYSKRFKPENGRSREAWAAERRERIGRAAQISVRVLEPKATAVGDAVEVQFGQRYKSDRVSGSVSKVLVLDQEADGWKIMREYLR